MISRLAVALLIVATQPLYAADFYARIKIQNLLYEAGTVGPGGQAGISLWTLNRHSYPFVQLQDRGECYVSGTGRSFIAVQNLEVAVKAQARKDIVGKLFVYQRQAGKWKAYKFHIPADRLRQGDAAQIEFLRAKSDYYERLIRLGLPGGHWFKYQSRLAFPGRVRLGRNRGRTNFNATVELASGRRAVAENLQLNRALRMSSDNQVPDIDVSTIPGIRVRAFEWTSRIKGKSPQLDRLAGLVPADQLAVFAKSQTILSANLHEANGYLAPLTNLVGMRTNLADLTRFYQRQMGLTSPALESVAVKSLAVTASDPFLEIGSDIAVLYETPTPKKLVSIIRATLAKRRNSQFTVERMPGTKGLTVIAAGNDRRTTSSYVVALGEVVVVSNSRYQLAKILQTWQRRRPNMSALEEYQFFRIRYPQQDNSLLVVMTDAAIRKWCGPQWRIGNSRRLRAAAELAELQAKHIGTLMSGKKFPPQRLARIGRVRGSAAGMHSDRYGNLAFMTPIAELKVSVVTSRERTAYERWRRQYETLWRRFDPIALQVTRSRTGWKSDLTVMPLIRNSEYNWIRRLAGKARIKPAQGDFHPESLLHGIFAMDSVLFWFPIASNGIEFFVDDDPLWKKYLRQAQDGKVPTREPGDQLPLAVRLNFKPGDSTKAYDLIKKLLRNVGEPSNKWQKVNKNGLRYESLGVAVVERLFVAVTSHSVIVSLNEKVLQRALVRTMAKQKRPNSKWLGEHFALRLRQGGVRIVTGLFRNTYAEQLRQQSWDAIPILNEWKRRFPNMDPVAVHERLWHERLRCPGGKYVWNAKARTMESTAFGHPGAAKFPKHFKTPLHGIKRVDLGATLESDGLRAAVEVVR